MLKIISLTTSFVVTSLAAMVGQTVGNDISNLVGNVLEYAWFNPEEYYFKDHPEDTDHSRSLATLAKRLRVMSKGDNYKKLFFN